MFKKPFRVKTQSVMKGSDRKRLRAEMLKNYLNLKEDILTDIIPNKEEVTVVKVRTHGGENVFVYCVEKIPLLFQVDKEKVLHPTVYLLWRYPDLIPRLTTWPPVFSKLMDGADLMLPGVIIRGEVTPNTFSYIRKGETCSVNLLGNRAAVAVGVAMLSGSDMFYAGMKGKGVHPLHYLGDELWVFGDKSKPPQLEDDPAPVEDFEEEEEEDKSEAEQRLSKVAAFSVSDGAEPMISIYNSKGGKRNHTDIVGGVRDLSVKASGSQGHMQDVTAIGGSVGTVLEADTDDVEEDETKEKEKMDDLLYFCFLCALKNSVKKADLPLLTRVFYTSHMMPFCPVGRNLDVKKSSYKKLSKFLQKQESSGFITVKEMSKGVDSIVEIERSHLELRDFVAPEPQAVASSESGAAPSEFQPPQLTELYGVTSNLLPVFQSSGHTKTIALSSAEVRAAVSHYVKHNKLTLPDSKLDIQLDPVLAEAVLTKSENNVTRIKWDALFSRIMNKMQPCYQVDVPGYPAIIRKGKIEPISIDVNQRASNKKVTLIENVEGFGIDAKEFAHCIQVKVACSGTVNPSQQKGRGPQVLVQGNQVSCVVDLLLEKYKIPKKYIRGTEKAPKKSKRK